MDGTGLKTDTFKETGPESISRFDGNYMDLLSVYWLCIVCPFYLNLWLQRRVDSKVCVSDVSHNSDKSLLNRGKCNTLLSLFLLYVTGEICAVVTPGSYNDLMLHDAKGLGVCVLGKTFY